MKKVVLCFCLLLCVALPRVIEVVPNKLVLSFAHLNASQTLNQRFS